MAKGVSKEWRRFEKLQRQDKIKERIFFENKERVYALGQFGGRARCVNKSQ